MYHDYAARVDKLRAIPNCDAIVLVPGANFTYFLGLDLFLQKRPTVAIITPDRIGLIVPKLELPGVAKSPLQFELFAWADEEEHYSAFEQAVSALGLRGKTLGIDGLTVRVFEWLELLRAAPSLKPHDVSYDLFRIRSLKTADEVDAIRRAIAVSEKALQQLIAHPETLIGQTEKQIMNQLDGLMKADGAEELAFDTHVQTGEASAHPHGNSGNRPLARDEFLLIDYGARMDGYPADITRTFCVGTPSAEMQKIYDAVYRANEAARQISGPGVAAGAVDKAARDVIEAAGYGEYFTHRTGHGLGIDGHEPVPQIAGNITYPLEVGQVFTIEPGIYVPGIGGVRIEDDVLVTDNGVEILTTFPYTFVIG